ncbi:MAG: hypothetical protein AAF193_00755, partial [Bacteroidota bacterium]
MVILAFCIGSRMLGSIFYIEDIDSLRFALAANDFSVAEARPHFPGYPIYCFFLQIVFFFTKSVGLSFSFLGGVATFLCVFFSERITKTLNIRNPWL